MKTIAFLLFFLCAGLSHAAESDTTKRWCPRGTGNSYNILASQILNGTDAARTATLNVNGNWGKLRVLVFHDYTNSGAVTITLTQSIDEGGTYASPVTCTFASGVCTPNNFTIVYTPSADVLQIYEFDVKGLTHMKLKFDEPSDDSTDTISVQACFVAGD